MHPPDNGPDQGGQKAYEPVPDECVCRSWSAHVVQQHARLEVHRDGVLVPIDAGDHGLRDGLGRQSIRGVVGAFNAFGDSGLDLLLASE